MTDAEKYLFDLNGYLVVEDALTPEQVSALNALVDAHWEADGLGGKATHRFGRTLAWGAATQAVIANPRMVPYLHALIGPQVRLDHDYLDVIRGGLGPIGATLHGGGTPHDPGQFYRFVDGRMLNGLTVVAYNLCDIHPGDGGFACVPGSHKANYPLPRAWADMSQGLADCVRPVTGPAGSAVIFTEALTHGTLPWRGAGPRRTLFFKYHQPMMAWGGNLYDPAEYPDLPTEARRMLEGANARWRGRPTEVDY